MTVSDCVNSFQGGGFGAASAVELFQAPLSSMDGHFIGLEYWVHQKRITEGLIYHAKGL